MRELNKRTGEVARAAWLYYMEELTQTQVASRLGVSRSTVIRLLQRAKDSGLVNISLGVSSDLFEVERDIERLYGLNKVRIVPDAYDETMQRRWIGQLAAETLVEMACPDAIIAVSWGSTLQSMADSLRGESSVPGMQIVSLIGGLHNASRGTNPIEVGKQLGEYFGAPAKALYAPVYVKNAATADGLNSDPGLQESLELARRASLVIFGMGTLSDEATMVRLGYINAEQRAYLQQRGAVGDLACRWLNAQGEPVEFPPSIFPIGVSLEELQKIPERLAVAGGTSKREVIRASLRGGYATQLVTDAQTALWLRANAR